MRQCLILLCCATFSLLSCNKQTTDSSSLIEPGVRGQFIATRTTRIIVLDEDTAVQYGEQARAFFYDIIGQQTPYRDAGVVKINGQDLTANASWLYAKDAESLGFNESCLWYAGLATGNQSLTSNDTSAFPSYNGALPYDINKTAGVTILLNTGDFTYTDSVRVVIADGMGNSVSQYSAINKDTIQFTPSSLALLVPTNMHEGTISVQPHRGVVRTINKYAYFFTKEIRITQSVNIY